MRKKLYAASMALALSLALCACGNKTEETETEAPTTEAATEASSVSDATATEATGEGLSTKLFTVNYDSDVWSYNKDDVYDDEEGCNVSFEIPDDEDSYKVKVYINATIGEPYSFRESLYQNGFDEKEYDEGGYDRIDIGGAEFVKNDTGYDINYLGRNEGANESFEIKVTGDLEASEVQPLLDGITFKITDIGNEDGPWYWEGEPFDASATDATIDSYTISTQQLKLEEPLVTHETFNHQIAYKDGKVYLLNENKMRAYTVDGTKLKLDKEYDLDDDYTNMDVTNDGKIYLSNFGSPLIEWEDGKAVNTYEDNNIKYVAMSPSGTFGISYFTSGEECFKVEIADGSATTTDMSFPEVDIISDITVSNDHIFVCGSPKEGEDGHTVFVYDTSGTFQQELHADDESIGLGSITYLAETSNGFMGMDGNMRTVSFWSKDGKYLGRIEDDALFSTSYPWFAGSCLADDGTLYTVMVDKRPDKSADEVLVFTVKGF